MQIFVSSSYIPMPQAFLYLFVVHALLFELPEPEKQKYLSIIDKLSVEKFAK